MNGFISDLIEMVCPKCGGSGKVGKEVCYLCDGWGYVSLAVHDEYVAKQHDEYLEEGIG